MKKVIKINEEQLIEAIQFAISELNESGFVTPFDDSNGDSTKDNPSSNGGTQQVTVTPIIQNDTTGTKTGRPITGDEFGDTLVVQSPIRNLYDKGKRY